VPCGWRAGPAPRCAGRPPPCSGRRPWPPAPGACRRCPSTAPARTSPRRRAPGSWAPARWSPSRSPGS
jgi:hypothetical protein